MIVPDVNLLLYAVVDAFPQHAVARRWWLDVVNGRDEIGLVAPAAMGFIRIVTHRQVLVDPMPLTIAIAHVRGWLARPNVRFLRPGPRHVEAVLDLLADAGTAGNLTTDAQIAALAMEHRAVVHSNDADFGRFRDLQWVDPLRGA